VPKILAPRHQFSLFWVLQWLGSLRLTFWGIFSAQFQKFVSLNMLKMPFSMQPCEKIEVFANFLIPPHARR